MLNETKSQNNTVPQTKQLTLDIEQINAQATGTKSPMLFSPTHKESLKEEVAVVPTAAVRNIPINVADHAPQNIDLERQSTTNSSSSELDRPLHKLGLGGSLCMALLLTGAGAVIGAVDGCIGFKVSESDQNATVADIDYWDFLEASTIGATILLASLSLPVIAFIKWAETAPPILIAYEHKINSKVSDMQMFCVVRLTPRQLRAALVATAVAGLLALELLISGIGAIYGLSSALLGAQIKDLLSDKEHTDFVANAGARGGAIVFAAYAAFMVLGVTCESIGMQRRNEAVKKEKKEFKNELLQQGFDDAQTQMIMSAVPPHVRPQVLANLKRQTPQATEVVAAPNAPKLTA